MKLPNYQCSLCYAVLTGSIPAGGCADSIEWSGVALGYIHAARSYMVVPDMEHTKAHMCNKCLDGLRKMVLSEIELTERGKQ